MRNGSHTLPVRAPAASQLEAKRADSATSSRSRSKSPSSKKKKKEKPQLGSFFIWMARLGDVGAVAGLPRHRSSAT